MEYLMALIGVLVIGIWAVYSAKKWAAESSKICDAHLADLEEAIEITRIVAKFRIYLLDIKERISQDEISTERARELVMAKKVKAFDQIHLLIATKADPDKAVRSDIWWEDVDHLKSKKIIKTPSGDIDQ